ncbi:MAG: DUF3040 domain-containing protein [Acidimicrobiales bacterium]
MALSEGERRTLEQLGHRLATDEPRLMAKLSGGTRLSRGTRLSGGTGLPGGTRLSRRGRSGLPRRPAGRRLRLARAAVALAAGVALVWLGNTLGLPVAVAGLAVMVLAALALERAAPARPAPAQPRPPSPRRGSRA